VIARKFIQEAQKQGLDVIKTNWRAGELARQTLFSIANCSPTSRRPTR